MNAALKSMTANQAPCGIANLAIPKPSMGNEMSNERRKLLVARKTDHKCPHDMRHPMGMEICPICDYDECEVCGLEYNRRDMSGDPRCYPCYCIAVLERKLEDALKAQATRKEQSARRRRENNGNQIGSGDNPASYTELA